MSYDLEVSNTDGGKLVDGESQITGVELNTTVGVTTSTPGLKLFSKMSGNFSINETWTPTGKSPTFESSQFTASKGDVVYGGRSGGSTGQSSITMPISYYKRVTRNFTENPGGLRNININSNVAGKLQQNGNKKVFSISQSKVFQTSKF